ncbi:MAG: BrnA antitoxin family protein [Synergistaceae bacterium]|jgi:uncharacterized protein (DUF4415 family)|nr:BrnA antitoxin family protein [Synergistaceae bacterium]
MGSRLPEIDDDGEVGDLSGVDPALFKPFSELPPSLQTKLRDRPRSAFPKQAVKICLDADILAALRASGEGWQTRINDALCASLALSGKVPLLVGVPQTVRRDIGPADGVKTCRLGERSETRQAPVPAWSAVNR